MRKDYVIKHVEGQPIRTTESVKQAVDARQDRRRFSGAEVECMLELNAGRALVITALDGLSRVRKEVGDKISPAVCGNLTNICNRFAGRMSTAQVISLDAQLNHGASTVVVTTTKAPPQYVNIRHDHLIAIIRGCCEEHCAFGCTLNREESKSCRIRRALDTIPGLPGENDGIHCPYYMVDMNEGGIDDDV